MAGAATAEVIDPTATEGAGTGAAGEGTKQPVVDPAKQPAVVKQPETPEKLELGVIEKNGKKFISMPYEDFKDRVRKSTTSELKKLFGTSDPKAILAIKTQYEEFKADAEKRQREEMTDRQKIEADRDKALSAKDVAERRAERARARVRDWKTDRVVTRAMNEHVHPDKLDFAVAMFRTELLGMSRRKADKLVGHEAEWFKSFVEKHPEMGKSAKVAPVSSSPRLKPKKLKTNGIDPKKAGKKPSATEPNRAGGKLVKDMTPTELRAYAQENGIKLPADMRLL